MVEYPVLLSRGKHSLDSLQQLFNRKIPQCGNTPVLNLLRNRFPGGIVLNLIYRIHSIESLYQVLDAKGIEWLLGDITGLAAVGGGYELKLG
jgi:hypothetical protein